MALLGRDDYRRKVLGCWLGKSVGGTLGQPHEGKQQVLELTFYDPVPDGAIANDDLDLQLIWLDALRRVGPTLDDRGLGDAWRKCHVYPFDEYGMALMNLYRQLDPPVSGQFANHFGDCMGAPIRSEIWACIAPGAPGLAARFAYYDGCVDHSGEGIWGEIFFAALESAAFVESDTNALLDAGLAAVPPECRTAGAVRLTRQLHADGLDWLAAREQILAEYGHVNFTDAPQNIAFTILGWLWGDDAGDMMCKAVNCGYDTDCTGATLGSILGLIHGPEVFEQKWVEPVGDEVVVGWGVVNCDCPQTLDELTDWTLAEAARVAEHFELPLTIGDETDLTGYDLAAASTDDLLAERLAHHFWTLTYESPKGLATVDLGGPPALQPGEKRTVKVSVGGRPATNWRAGNNHGWQVDVAGAPGEIVFTAPLDIASKPWHELQIALMDDPPTKLDFAVVPACGWRVSGPHRVADAAAALADPPELNSGTPRWTPDHRLVLDTGLDYDRLYLVRTRLWIPVAHDVRLVSATPSRQRVKVDGEVVLVKDQPTRFIPAAHRSGPGTATEVAHWSAGEREVEILLAIRAGEQAETHLFLTRPRDIEGPKMVPYEDVVHRMP